MNSKLTIVFAVLLVILLAVYFLGKDGETGTENGGKTEKALAPGLKAENVTRIDIEPREGEAVSLERVGTRDSYWRVKKPVDRPADPQVVQQMLYALTRFERKGEIQVESDAAVGLDAPRLEVTFHAGAERAKVRFGIPSPLNTAEVYYRVGDDAAVHLVDVGTYDAFTKPASEIRASQLIRFQPHKAVKIGLRSRFLVVRGKEREVEYETSLLEKVEKGGVPGWYLVEPWKEFVDPLKPGRLLAGLAGLSAKEFQAMGKQQVAALKEAEDIVDLHLFGVEKPITVRVAGKGPAKNERWVQVEGLDEAAVVDLETLRYLPIRRNDFRLDTIFRFARPRVKTVTIDAPGLGKTVIERTEKKRGADAPATVAWTVREPAGIRVEDEKVELFVKAVLNQKIESFLEVQDLKLMKLDKPDVTMTVELKDDDPRIYHFSLTSTGGFLRKEGMPEAYQVSSSMVEALLRVELNFLHPEVFNVRRQDLRRFEFEWKESGNLRPVFYRMALNTKTKFWEFHDDGHRGGKVDHDRVGDLLTFLNYIKARTYLTRDPKRIKELGLNDVEYAGRLRIWLEGAGEPAEFYISADQSKVVSARKHYMLRGGDTAIFEINPLLVESLRATPVLKE